MHSALHLPAFPLEALLRSQPVLRGQPCAVIDPAQPDDRTRAKAPLLAVNPPAARAGIHPDMSAIQALARCPELTTLDRHPDIERELASQLRELAHTLAPRVEAAASDSLLLDVATLPAARSDPSGWLNTTLDALASLGIPVQAALADNPQLAHLASLADETSARLDFEGPEPVITPSASSQPVAPDQLHPLPLSLLVHFGLEAEHLGLFRQLGLQTLGDFARLPAQALGERFGSSVRRLHELLHDQIRHPITHHEKPEKYFETIDFEYEINSSEILIFYLKRLLQAIVSKLCVQRRAAVALRLELGFGAAPAQRRMFRLPEPSSDPVLLLRPLQVHLESLQLPGPVTGLLLEVVAGLPGAAQHHLFERALRDPHRLAATLARLESILGPDSVGIPVRADSHRPDSFRMEPFNPGAAVVEAADRPGELAPPPLPLRRFRPPLTLAMATESGRGGLRRPLAVLSGPRRGRVARFRGPFPLSGHWWDPDSAWQQIEWDVELDSGHLLRLAMVPPDEWRLEGEYG